MRLIDADKLGLTDFEIFMCDGDYKEALKLLLSKIDNAPTIDAVPFVRCKDCKHFTPGRNTGDWGTCEITQSPGPEYSSCFDGERGDEDNENNETD